MQSAKKSSTRLANAFSSQYLTRARQRDRTLHEEGSSLDVRALAAGPWDVQAVDAPFGRVHAIVRRGEPVSDGFGAVALCRSCPEALQLAAVLPSLGVENRLEIGDRSKPLGLALHDGRRFVAHLPPDGPAAAPAVAAHLHVARCLAADLDSLALLHRSLGSEALVLLGRELMRRME